MVAMVNALFEPLCASLGSKSGILLLGGLPLATNCAICFAWEHLTGCDAGGRNGFILLCGGIGVTSSLGYSTFMHAAEVAMDDRCNQWFRRGFLFASLFNIMVVLGSGFQMPWSSSGSVMAYWNGIGAICTVGLVAAAYLILKIDGISCELSKHDDRLRDPEAKAAAAEQAAALADQPVAGPLAPFALSSVLIYGPGMLIFVMLPFVVTDKPLLMLALEYVYTLGDAVGQEILQATRPKWLSRSQWLLVAASIVRFGFVFVFMIEIVDTEPATTIAQCAGIAAFVGMYAALGGGLSRALYCSGDVCNSPRPFAADHPPMSVQEVKLAREQAYLRV